MHRVEIRFPPEMWFDNGDPDRFAMLLEYTFDELELDFSLDEGGPNYRLRVADLKRGLDIIIQQLRDIDCPPETIVRVVSGRKIAMNFRLGDLAPG